MQDLLHTTQTLYQLVGTLVSVVMFGSGSWNTHRVSHARYPANPASKHLREDHLNNLFIDTRLEHGLSQVFPDRLHQRLHLAPRIRWIVRHRKGGWSGDLICQSCRDASLLIS
jgi:hypothetical protein